MVIGSTAYIANIGNSRTYLYHESDGLKKITNDHSAVAFLIEKGVLTPEDLYTHRARNVIKRALFNESSVEVDLFTVPLQSGDALLLCSYGLWMTVHDPEIENVLSHVIPDSSRATEMLIQAALDGNSRDNISAIVVSILEAQDQAPVLGLQLFVYPDDIRIPQE